MTALWKLNWHKTCSTKNYFQSKLTWMVSRVRLYTHLLQFTSSSARFQLISIKSSLSHSNHKLCVIFHVFIVIEWCISSDYYEDNHGPQVCLCNHTRACESAQLDTMLMFFLLFLVIKWKYVQINWASTGGVMVRMVHESEGSLELLLDATCRAAAPTGSKHAQGCWVCN